MSGIAGIFDVNLAAASATGIRRLRPCGARLSGYRQPWMLLRTLGAQDESDILAEIFCTETGTVVAWEGRLDNRGDLRRELGLALAPSDANIVAELYDARGESSISRLIGDWSLVIWDPAHRRLLLASDYAGVRPLYYRYTYPSLAFSSSLRELAECCGGTHVDHDYLAEFALYGASAMRTPYPGVVAVPPGHTVCISAAGISTRRFWRLDPGKRIRYRRDSEYEEHCRHLIQEAVGVRLRTAGPVYAELSGGLDSSSVVSIARRLISSRGVEAPRLVSITYRHPSCQDEAFYREIETVCGIQSVHMDAQPCRYINSEPGGPAPEWWETRHREVARLLSIDGSTVFLTGQLGDLVMGNWLDDSEQVADLLLEGRLGHAWSDALAWGEVLQRPVSSVLAAALGMAMPWYSWRQAADRFRTGNFRGIEDSIQPEIRRRIGHPADSGTVGVAWDWPPSRRKHVQALADMLRRRVLRVPEDFRGVLYTHPYAHRPLVEFMLAIPAQVVCGPGAPRRLMRRALRGVVPGKVLDRRSKSSFGTVFREALLPLAADLLGAPGRMEMVERGIIDPASLELRLRRFLCGLERNEPQLRQIVLLEYWLRNRSKLSGSRVA